MSARPEEIDLSHITPEHFAALIAGSDDDLILRTVRGTGARPVLDRVFQGMQQRFLPEKATKVDATFQWVVTDEGEEYPFAVTIKGGTCQIERGTIENPTTTLTNRPPELPQGGGRPGQRAGALHDGQAQGGRTPHGGRRLPGLLRGPQAGDLLTGL